MIHCQAIEENLLNIAIKILNAALKVSVTKLIFILKWSTFYFTEDKIFLFWNEASKRSQCEFQALSVAAIYMAGRL